MSTLKLELPDDTYDSLVATAKKIGMTADEWAVRRLRALSLTDDESNSSQ